MTSTRPRLAAALVASIALVLTLVPTTPGSAANGAAVPYLALGDSLPYGWDTITQPISVEPEQHVGYPEVLAERSPLEVTNASCPGETSGSFLDRDAPSNGCTQLLAADIAPKVDWDGGSQLDFALGFLAENADTGLVSIQLGANDLFLCQADPVDGCTSADFSQVLQTTATNLAAAIISIRGAGYQGPIALVAYYSLDYRDPSQVIVAEASRSVLQGIAEVFDDVVVADGYAAFEQASRRADGDPCAAGLLLPIGGGECDVHTTPRGDRVLAQAVREAVHLGGIVSNARTGR